MKTRQSIRTEKNHSNVSPRKTRKSRAILDVSEKENVQPTTKAKPQAALATSGSYRTAKRGLKEASALLSVAKRPKWAQPDCNDVEACDELSKTETAADLLDKRKEKLTIWREHKRRGSTASMEISTELSSTSSSQTSSSSNGNTGQSGAEMRISPVCPSQGPRRLSFGPSMEMPFSISSDENSVEIEETQQGALLSVVSNIAAARAEADENGREAAMLRTRMEEKERELKSSKAELSRVQRQCETLSETIRQLTNRPAQHDFTQMQITLQHTQRENLELIEQLEENKKDERKLQAHIQTVTSDNGKLKARLQELEQQLVACQSAVTSMEAERSVLEAHILNIESKLEDVMQREKDRESDRELERLIQVKDKTIKKLRSQVTTLQQTADDCRLEAERKSRENAQQVVSIQELMQRVESGEELRRKLHQMIQSLRGNIRVYCRVRPMLHSETDLQNLSQPSSVVFPDTAGEHRSLELMVDSNKRHFFSFDKVFPPESTQGEVFNELHPFIQSALDGDKVCIFAYGQTGSGKTFTMEGPGLSAVEGVSATSGMIPRSVDLIFREVARLQQQGYQLKLEVSCLEIYNEQLRDLLSTSSGSTKPLTIAHGHGKKKAGRIITGLSSHTVTEAKEVFTLIQTAAAARAVEKTAANDRSSRSHSVFQLHIHGISGRTQQEIHGNLNIVDLAGSERLSNSTDTSDKVVQEMIHINKSLTHLGNVIAAIQNKEKHIPYRNCKLTQLLQDALGAESKTLMFVNLSPLSCHSHESLNSLRFATKVSLCN